MQAATLAPGALLLEHLRRPGPLVSVELRPPPSDLAGVDGIENRIELNLVDREDLSFRLLLGRTALAGDFLIDVHQAYVLGKPPPRKRRKVNT